MATYGASGGRRPNPARQTGKRPVSTANGLAEQRGQSAGPAGRNGKKRPSRGSRLAKRLLAVLLVIFLLLLAAEVYGKVRQRLERESYRLEYTGVIAGYAAEYGLDPYLVAAVIYVESGWQTEAESPKGALGLMQLMPATAEWIAGRLGEEYDPAAICEPEVNIRYGCWYLRFLFDRFPVTATALAAYNAGHNRVAEWLSSEEYSPDGSVLTSIPYPETEQYVGKVQRAYEKYKELYPNAFEEE